MASKASKRSQLRKRRQARADHREKTADVRKLRNEAMRASGHPGWQYAD